MSKRLILLLLLFVICGNLFSQYYVNLSSSLSSISSDWSYEVTIDGACYVGIVKKGESFQPIKFVGGLPQKLEYRANIGGRKYYIRVNWSDTECDYVYYEEVDSMPIDIPNSAVIVFSVYTQVDFNQEEPIVCVEDGSESFHIKTTKGTKPCSGGYMPTSPPIDFEVTCDGVTENFTKNATSDIYITYSSLKSAFGTKNIFNKEIQFSMSFGSEHIRTLNDFYFIPKPTFTIDIQNPECFEDPANLKLTGLPTFDAGKASLLVYVKNNGHEESFSLTSLSSDNIAFSDYISFGITAGECQVEAQFDDGTGVGNLCSVPAECIIKAPDPIIIGNVEVQTHPAQNGTSESYHITTNGGTASGTITISGRAGSNFTCDIPGVTIGDFSTAIKIEDNIYKYPISGLKEGVNTIIVSDENGCKSEGFPTIAIKQVSVLSKVKKNTIVDVQCHGDKTGSVKFDIIGGFGPYKVTLSASGHADSVKSVNTTSGIFENLDGANYTIKVEDTEVNNPLKSVSSDVFTIKEASEGITYTLDVNQIDCNGDKASFSLKAEGGFGLYDYKGADISADNKDANFTLEKRDLIGGEKFTCQIKDDLGCSTGDIPIAINDAPAKIVISGLNLNSTMGVDGKEYHILNASGKASGTLTITGRSGDYKILSPSGAKLTHKTDNIYEISDLDAGSQEIKIGHLGCISNIIKSVQINKVVPVNFDNDKVGKTDITCYGKYDGTVSFGLKNGCGPYDIYLYSGESVYKSITNTNLLSETFSGVTNGIYKLKVYDRIVKNTIEFPSTIEIEKPDRLELTATPINPLCFGYSDGKISLNATGGSGNNVFTIEGSPCNASNTFKAGTYTCLVTDENGCTDSKLAVLKDPNPILFDLTKGDESCENANNGKIQINNLTHSENLTMTYHLLEPSDKACVAGEYLGLDAGNYNVTISDNNNCSTTKSVTVKNLGEFPIITCTVLDSLACESASNGAVDVDFSAVTSYGLYDSNDKRLSGESTDDTKFTGLDNQEYYFSATDANNCSSTLPITVPVSENAVNLTREEWIPATCSTANNGIINIEALGGVPDTFGYTFFFNGIEKKGFSAEFAGLEVGTEGKVTVTDQLDCKAETEEKKVQVTSDLLQITAVDKTDPVCFGTNSGEIKPTILNGSETLIYTIEEKDVDDQYILLEPSNYVVESKAYKGLYAGVYKIIVDELDGCSSSYGIELLNPEKAEVTESNYNYIKVKGELTGEYEITLTGKDKPFTYELKKLVSGDVDLIIDSGNLLYTDPDFEIVKKFGSLVAGNYRFSLKDNNSCLDFDGSDTYTEEFTIQEPEFELSYTDEVITDVSCNGLSDGAISISGFGGWGEYTYSLNGGLWQNNGNFTNLSAGNYSIEIRDREETSITHLITLTEPDIFSLAIDKYKDATCPAYANGRVFATSLNGVTFTNGLHYWIENTDDRSIVFGDRYSNNSYEFKDLPKGNYEIFVSDSHTCSDSKSFSINEPDVATIDLDNNYIKTKGDATGEISLNISGGNGLFDYKCILNDESAAFKISQTTEAIQLSDLLAGTYHILVRDTAGCVYEDKEWMERTIDIREPDLALSAEVKDKSEVSCYSLSNGSIRVDAIGGWGDYSYSLDGVAWQKDGTYSNLIAGDYSILIRDSVDISYLYKFNISEPDTLNIEIDKIKDATCPAYANGRVIATSLNGVPFGNGLHYWIENSEDNSIVLGDQFSDNSYQFKQLPKGNYELFVSDSHSCEASKTFSINEPEPAKIELTHNYIKAKGDAAGEISLNLSGGNGTFDYECYLNNSSEKYKQDQVKSEIALNNLLAGTYTFLVRDTAGCVYEDKEWMERIVEMREPDLALSFDIEEQRDVTCFGLTDGYLKLKGIGGWGDYRFQLDADSQTVFNEFPGLPAKVYQLQISDSVGISWKQKISIIEPDLLTAEYLSHKDVNCFGGNDGEIILKIEGGNQDYNLSLNEIDWITGSAMTELVKADYDIFVKDSKGCKVKVETINIDQPDEITLLSSLVTKSRCSNNEGSIVTDFSGGVGQYTYQWLKDTLVDGSFVWKEILNSNSSTINNLFSSQYIVKVRDEHKCELSFDFALGDITDLTVESIKVEDVSCFGYNDGKAAVLVKNGNFPYTYSWDVDITESNKDLAWDILAGTYNLLVRDEKGCSVSDKFTVGSPDPLSYQIDEIVQPLCYGGEKGLINLHGVGGTADYEYSWKDGRTKSSIQDLKPDVYSLTIKDVHNCESTFDFEMQYQRELRPFIGNDTLICHYNSLLLSGGDYSDYNWSSDFGFSSSKAQVDLTEPGKYYLQVKDEDKCLGFDTLSLDVSYFKIAGLVKTDVTCNDFADGRAQIELTPLNWESTVVWPDGRNGLVWDKLSGGNYTVEVEDSFACKDSRDFVIYEPDTLSVDVESLLHPICSDVPNGEIALVTIGGNGSYLYQWNNGGDKAKISDLDQGKYSVLIEDEKHCQISKIYDLAYQKTIQADLGLDFLGPDTLICHYNSLPLDGRDFARHYWTSDLGYSSSNRYVELNNPDNYYLRIEDEDKCFAYDTIKLSVSYLKIDDLVSTDVTCNSFADGKAQIEVSPTDWKHIIEWSDGSHASTWNNLSGGDYQVQITDDYGCSDKREFSIYEPEELKIEVENLFHPLCFGVPDGFIRLNPLGGNGDYQFAWDHGSDKSRLTKLDQGDYSVLLTDKKGCQASENFTLEYQKAIYPDLGEDLVICSNNFVSLYPGSFAEYQWMEGNRILENTEPDLVVWDSNEYSVEVKDEDACTASDTINVSLKASELNPVLLSASSVAVGDTLMVMDVSQPQPESLTWEFTGPHIITEQAGFYCLVVFSEEGMFGMKMSALLNDCIGEVRESILVVPASEKADDRTETQSEAYVHLKKLIIAPNPSDGNFAADVELVESAEITFYLVNLQNGQVLEKRRRSGLKTYRENYSLSQSGSYCVYAESKGERKVVKLIVL